MINFIVNQQSGKGLGHKNLVKIIDYCYSHKIEYTVHITSRKGHAEKLAQAICAYGFDTVVAVGGDGTFHEVLNGMDFDKAALGFIPSGRGNDYAKAAKLSLDPIEALKAIIRGERVTSDYMEVDTRRCLNIAGTGLDVEVLKRVEERKHTKINYLLSLIYCLKHFKSYSMTITNDEGAKDYDCLMVGVCNGIAIGGGMKISPKSDLNDGKLNVVIMQMPKDGKILKVLPKFTKGKHLDLSITTHYLADEVKVDGVENYPIQLDGEIYDNLKLHCKIVKGGMKTFKV